jgi:hypothetical protein
MARPFFILAAGLGACCLLTGAGATGQSLGQQPADQAMERINLLDGSHYDGLVESAGDGWVYFIQVQRPPGQATRLVIRTLEPRSVVSIVRLDDRRRAELREQIRQFTNRAAIEAGRMDAVSLSPLDKEGNHYQHYASRQFSLDSTADQPTTRRVIVRVEQIFAAYRQMLAPRSRSPRPPRLVVFSAMEQYQAFLAARGVKIHNRACFLERENVVAVGSELDRWTARMAKVNAQTDQIGRELRALEGRLKTRLAGLADQMRKEGHSPSEIAKAETVVRRQFENDAKEKKKELDRCDRETAQAFQGSTRQLFARVYHESFHAYLENCVFPHEKYDVPRWLNEGLAVTFEAGVLEANTLRVDAPNAAALKRLKADLSGPQPLPLERLLSTSAAAFLQRHDTDWPNTDRLYAYAWGLAYYLAFEKHLLDGPALGEYVAPEAGHLAPVARFEKLVGMRLSEFEKQWRAYILGLR